MKVLVEWCFTELAGPDDTDGSPALNSRILAGHELALESHRLCFDKECGTRSFPHARHKPPRLAYIPRRKNHEQSLVHSKDYNTVTPYLIVKAQPSH